MTRIAPHATFILNRSAAIALDIMRNDYPSRKGGLPPAKKEFFVMIEVFDPKGVKLNLFARTLTYRELETLTKSSLRSNHVPLPTDFFNPTIFTVTVCPVDPFDRTRFTDVSNVSHAVRV